MPRALAQTLAAAAAGDRAAYSDVVRHYAAMVSAVILAVVKDVPTSEDIAQEVFVTAWARRTELRDPSRYGGWLRQMARNRALTHQRSRGRAERAHLAVPEAQPPSTGEDLLLDAERCQVLRDGLEELAESNRVAMLLYYWEGHDVKRVAALLDVPPATVRKRLSRGREHLRGGVHARFAGAARRSAPSAAFIATLVASAPGTARGASLSVGMGLAAAAVLSLGLAGTALVPLARASGEGNTSPSAQPNGQFATATEPEPAPAADPSHRFEALSAWNAALGKPYFGCAIDDLPPDIEPDDVYGIVHDGAVWPSMPAQLSLAVDGAPHTITKLRPPSEASEGVVSCRVSTQAVRQAPADAPNPFDPDIERSGIERLGYAFMWGITTQVTGRVMADHERQFAVAEELSHDTRLSPEARDILAHIGSADMAEFDRRLDAEFPPPDGFLLRSFGRTTSLLYVLYNGMPGTD